MLSKEKIKKHWNENKDFYIGVACGVLGACVGLSVGIAVDSLKTRTSNGMTMEEMEFYKTLGKSMKGSKMYVSITENEFANIQKHAHNGCVQTNNGIRLNVKGGILFGNMVN